jgi:hypothetical protein
MRSHLELRILTYAIDSTRNRFALIRQFSGMFGTKKPGFFKKPGFCYLLHKPEICYLRVVYGSRTLKGKLRNKFTLACYNKITRIEEP